MRPLDLANRMTLIISDGEIDDEKVESLEDSIVIFIKCVSKTTENEENE